MDGSLACLNCFNPLIILGYAFQFRRFRERLHFGSSIVEFVPSRMHCIWGEIHGITLLLGKSRYDKISRGT